MLGRLEGRCLVRDSGAHTGSQRLSSMQEERFRVSFQLLLAPSENEFPLWFNTMDQPASSVEKQQGAHWMPQRGCNPQADVARGAYWGCSVPKRERVEGQENPLCEVPVIILLD